MNDLNKILDKHNPYPFEPVIIGTLLTAKEPDVIYSMLKRKVKSEMFSDENKGLFSVICEMIECDEALRSYMIIERCISRGLAVTGNDIANFRMNKSESDFAITVETFVSQWYDFNLSKNALQYSIDIQSGFEIMEAYAKMIIANEEIEEIRNIDENETISLSVSANEVINDIDERMGKENTLSGKSFGIRKLDFYTGGAHDEALYMIGGAGGDGKTTLAMQLAVFMAEYCNVDFYSLEMSTKQLIPKILSAKSGISKNKLQHAKVSKADISTLRGITKEKTFDNLKIIDDIHELQAIETSIKKRVKKFNTGAIFIDNRTIVVHKLKGSSTDDITIALSYRFKRLARIVKKPIFLLVHKNKDNSSRADKRPTSSDIKYGGDIAADVIIFPYRTLITDDNRRTDGFEPSEIVITKNRIMGDVGYIPTLFDPNFDTYCEIDIDDQPIKGYDPYKQNHSFNIANLTVEPKENNIISRKHAPVEEDEIPF